MTNLFFHFDEKVCNRIALDQWMALKVRLFMSFIRIKFCPFVAPLELLRLIKPFYCDCVGWVVETALKNGTRVLFYSAFLNVDTSMRCGRVLSPLKETWKGGSSGDIHQKRLLKPHPSLCVFFLGRYILSLVSRILFLTRMSSQFKRQLLGSFF